MDSSEQSLSMPFALRLKLSAMMFLQFMTLPVWFNTVVPYVKTLPGGEKWVVWCGMFMGFGMLLSPLCGMFADRFLNAERVFSLCNFICTGLLAACFFVRDPAVLFFLLLAACAVSLPCWSIVSTIALANAPAGAFPHIRVFGSLGWVASAVFSVVGINCFGIADFDKTPWIFASGALVTLLCGLLGFILPPTPPKAKGTPMSIVDALGLRALVLLRNPTFAVFAVLLVLAMIPFQWYMSYNTTYLDESGFKYLTLTQNLGQVGELAFMLLLPILLKKCGYKWAMVLGIGALAFRYACFWGCVTFGCPALDFGGILVHGLIFGLLIIGAQMYVDDFAPAELRNQAQGLVMCLTAGVGVFLSVGIFDRVLKANVLSAGGHDWAPPYLLAFVISAILTVLMAVLFRPSAARKG